MPRLKAKVSTVLMSLEATSFHFGEVRKEGDIQKNNVILFEYALWRWRDPSTFPFENLPFQHAFKGWPSNGSRF